MTLETMEKGKHKELSSLLNKLPDTRNELNTMRLANLSQQEALRKMELEYKSLESSNLDLKHLISKHTLEACNSKKEYLIPMTKHQ